VLHVLIILVVILCPHHQVRVHLMCAMCMQQCFTRQGTHGVTVDFAILVWDTNSHRCAYTVWVHTLHMLATWLVYLRPSSIAQPLLRHPY
jgi:hypothetical protein